MPSGAPKDAPYFTTEYGRGMVGVPATRHRVHGRYMAPGFLTLVAACWTVGGFGLSEPLAGILGLVFMVGGGAFLARVHALYDGEPSFWVDADGVSSDGLTIPWTSINRVERTTITGPVRSRHFRLRGPAPEVGTWNLLVLEIVEFDGVRGLRPAIIGLANLQRRRRIVLAAASELYAPESVVAALEFLLQHPNDRSLMGNARSETLFLTGSPP